MFFPYHGNFSVCFHFEMENGVNDSNNKQNTVLPIGDGGMA